MNRPKTLSAAFVKTVQAYKEPRRYGDGRGSFGLSLLVKNTTTGRVSRTWCQRLQIDGVKVSIGLGAYPVVSLSQARAAALANRRAVHEGIDPRRKTSRTPTFQQAADAVIELNAGAWRNRRSESQWRASLMEYVYPHVGNKRVDAITSADVLEVLAPIWTTKATTARRVKQRIGAVLTWAIGQGYRQDNPADAATAVLPRGAKATTHMASLAPAEVAGALAKVAAADAAAPAKLALRFLVLTAARSGEVRGAQWAEIDLGGKTWTVPADRMKGAVEHRIPLSGAAMDVLEAAQSLSGTEGLVFQSNRAARPLSGTTLSALLRAEGIACVPHGMRASFRNWCAQEGVSREVAEAGLAHTVGGVEGAYFTDRLLDQRREVMEDWGSYVAGE